MSHEVGKPGKEKKIKLDFFSKEKLRVEKFIR